MLCRSYYSAGIGDFLSSDQDAVLGEMVRSHSFPVELPQRNAWIEQISHLKANLGEFRDGRIFFEFSIPRMGKRVDVILLIKGVVFVLEYKVGAKAHHGNAKDQVLDYALDLKNFHEGSHSRYIVPILISTKAAHHHNLLAWDADKVAAPLLANENELAALIKTVLTDLAVPESSPICAEDKEWEESGYKPTPTIIEAAQALYQGHHVEEISRSDAGAQNLATTSRCIFEIIAHSKACGRKSICFVTGVPGAGKTLAGLNISNRKSESGSKKMTVFLSGNGPLVSVLREALTRDEVARSKEQEDRISKEDARRKVSTFIQNIHHFRDEGMKSDQAPPEHVIIFDEAQRAWDRDHAEKFMVQKRGAQKFEMSEPEFLISVMDRRQDWATIVCLIGGGQEINTGEAGLVEWFNALQRRFSHWDVYHSGQLAHKNYSWGEDLASKISALHAEEKRELHLSVSMRSFRAERLSEFVGAIIDGDAVAAARIRQDLPNYPLALTRELGTARSWLKSHARGTERMGLVASSGGLRLRPEGIHVKSKIDAASWFLNSKDDVRSSYYLEEVATEFDIQGLELDWTGVCWDADFRREQDQWGLYDFTGSAWHNVNNSFRRIYLANAYRVLLTRARQGMIIFVPRGDNKDHTRPARFYDGTYEFLRSCGIEEI